MHGAAGGAVFTGLLQHVAWGGHAVEGLQGRGSYRLSCMAASSRPHSSAMSSGVRPSMSAWNILAWCCARTAMLSKLPYRAAWLNAVRPLSSSVSTYALLPSPQPVSSASAAPARSAAHAQPVYATWYQPGSWNAEDAVRSDECTAWKVTALTAALKSGQPRAGQAGSTVARLPVLYTQQSPENMATISAVCPRKSMASASAPHCTIRCRCQSPAALCMHAGAHCEC